MGDTLLKKTYRVICILIWILGVFSFFVGSATLLPPSPPETQGISTRTVVSSDGSFSHGSSMQWALSNEALGMNTGIIDPIPDPPEWGVFPEPPLNLERGEVQMHATYSEETFAHSGVIEYTRSTDIDTAPTVRGGSNVENYRLINFIGYDGGRIVSTEDLVLDTVATPINVEYGKLCPFMDVSRNCIPASCNLVETGSIIDMSQVSASSAGSIRNVNPPGEPGHAPTLPSVGDPALVDYLIRISEFAPAQPSLGSVSAYLDITSLEGGRGCLETALFSQVAVEEYRRVEGQITRFSYIVDYESGVKR